MTNVATRLLSLIMLLQKRPGWKSAELAAELGVSERTIFRYMGMLDELGIPLYSERGPNGGFSLVRGYKLPPLIFSAEEATVLYMGANLVRDIWGQTYSNAVTAVTAKLDNVLPDDLLQEVARAQESLVVISGMTRRDYSPWDPVIHTLRQCMRDQCCVRLQYRGLAHDADTTRVVEPYALALQWGLWYLVGFCRLRQEMRTFRLDRIQQAAPLKDRFSRPRDFSVREYLECTMSVQPAYRVAVLIEAGAARMVQERHGHWMTLAGHPDGSLTARFRDTNLDWATGWVLSLGGAARALEPAELVTRVQEAARAALKRYEDA
jgi:predicted DNA-binding transcriptional regulator YafY